MSIKVVIAKTLAKIGGPVSKLGSGSGKSFAGIIFSKVAGIDAISELSSDLGIGSIILTGTNGKTTTTTLTSLFLKEAGKNVFVGGNIGIYSNNISYHFFF